MQKRFKRPGGAGPVTSRVLRYQLPIDGAQRFQRMPKSHTVLSVAPARDSYAIDMWVHTSDVWNGVGDVDRPYWVVGTGHEIPEGLTAADFVGTCVMTDGLVWHVYTQDFA